jgi:AAA-like domain
MNVEEALELIECVLPPGSLTPVKVLVFRQAWMDKEYGVIAKESGYDVGYIREAGAQLWRSLSLALREPVKKKNFRVLLQQRFGILPAKLPTANGSDSPQTSDIPDYPSGPVPLHSKFYIDRPTVESKAYTEITKPGNLLHIKAPAMMGKSSFLLRLIEHAQTLDYRVVDLDFKQADAETFSNLTRFLRWFCINVSYQLDIEPRLDLYWSEDMGSKASCTLYFTKYLLKHVSTPVVLALNDFDYVLSHPALAQEISLLLRSWYESAKQIELLQKLRLVLIYTDTSSAYWQPSSSLFTNIGQVIELPEFDMLQVQTLAQRYGLGWTSSKPVEQLMSQVGGHPYLVQLALYGAWNQTLTVNSKTPALKS